MASNPVTFANSFPATFGVTQASQEFAQSVTPLPVTCVYPQYNDVAALLGQSNWPYFSWANPQEVGFTLPLAAAGYVSAPIIAPSTVQGVATFAAGKVYGLEYAVDFPDCTGGVGGEYAGAGAWVIASDVLTGGPMKYYDTVRSLDTGNILVRGYNAAGAQVTLATLTPGTGAITDMRVFIYIDSDTGKVGVKVGSTDYGYTDYVGYAGKPGVCIGAGGAANSAAVTGNVRVRYITSSADWTIAPAAVTHDMCGNQLSGYLIDEYGNYLTDEYGNYMTWSS